MQDASDIHEASGQARFTGYHMLMILLAFFGTVIVVNGYMAYEASKSWTGLIVKNGYVASQDFNHKQAEWQSQAARGWTGDIRYDAGKVSLTIMARNGEPVRLSNVSAVIGRPAFEKQDHIVTLADAGNGVYEVEDTLAKGPWQIAITADSAEGPYRLEKRILVKDGQ